MNKKPSTRPDAERDHVALAEYRASIDNIDASLIYLMAERRWMLAGGWRPRALASGYLSGAVFAFKTNRLHMLHVEFRQSQIDH